MSTQSIANVALLMGALLFATPAEPEDTATQVSRGELPQDEDDIIVGSIRVERGADLEALARITEQDAVDTAIAAVDGATAESVEEVTLTIEDGFLVYEIELDADGEEWEVLIDAGDGRVLEAERDDFINAQL